MLTQNEINQLQASVKDAFPEKVTYSEMIDCVVKCMSMVGVIKDLSGEQKKDLVIDLLIFAMEETDSGAMEKYEHYFKEIIPKVIDFLISTENGKITFNPKIKNTCDIFFKCGSK